ncbi:MAG TPA: competence/damage-inducible protein A [Bacteroidales bacterium]|nr:competence/damage-inducible protein A [Bacteroidales bacterium]HCI54694.1 competence/damage-inducible protein A [Bacteroidales bacterium]HOU95633.1 competence/damage-inducible protein A [Bacteroidales bacterium]HQG36042.1 competence/damage-inducible protein A [Bacteroidales bacterium]HQG52804.1 competence/damage-inducible protein A [Bacteroidales bacterium]
MNAQIINIGDELLIGQTVNTNAAYIGAELSKIGFDICQITIIPDRRENILKALSEVIGKSDVVLVTGGLGPTSDDITKQTVCEFFNTVLLTNMEVLSMIEIMAQRRNFRMNEKLRSQADVPASCKVLINSAGTAPGMWFEKEGTIFVFMPGVPLEMKYIMNEHVIPELKRRFSSMIIIHKNIMTYGTYEAKLAELLEGFEAELPSNIKLAYLPSFGVIKLRLTGSGNDKSKLEKEIEEQVKKLYNIIPEYIYGEDEEQLEEVVGRLLKKKGHKLCTAESCTGGRIAQMITSVPGSSAYYKGSVIAYDNTVKTNLLNVNESTIENFGAVSCETAEEMARGVLELFGCNFAVATTGIAGPDGGTTEKPVGTVWIAVATPEKITSEKFQFTNDRVTNITRFSLSALNLLRLRVINS